MYTFLTWMWVELSKVLCATKFTATSLTAWSTRPPTQIGDRKSSMPVEILWPTLPCVSPVRTIVDVFIITTRIGGRQFTVIIQLVFSVVLTPRIGATSLSQNCAIITLLWRVVVLRLVNETISTPTQRRYSMSAGDKLCMSGLFVAILRCMLWLWSLHGATLEGEAWCLQFRYSKRLMHRDCVVCGCLSMCFQHACQELSTPLICWDYKAVLIVYPKPVAAHPRAISGPHMCKHSFRNESKKRCRHWWTWIFFTCFL